jgi:beta-xylosidase
VSGRRLIAAFGVAVTLVAGCGDGPAGNPWEVNVSGTDRTYTNPVYRGDSPDPQAIRVGETWILFHTNSRGLNVPVMTSPDLVDWTPAGEAMPRLPDWADPGRTWAPEVLALAPDRFVLYYTAAARGAGRQCIGRAVATEPLGPYRDQSSAPLVCQPELGGSIDASPFRDTDGSLYLLWKSDGNAIGVDTWLYAQRLTDDGLRLTGEPTRLLKQTERWEGNIVEAPFCWRHDGRLLLFFAANAYDTNTYGEGYAVCESPLGPCVKATENPILHSTGAASGPGHASMVEKDGRTWLLYHAWPPGAEGSADAGRQLWLDEVTWVDGKPRVAGPSTNPRPRP